MRNKTEKAIEEAVEFARKHHELVLTLKSKGFFGHGGVPAMVYTKLVVAGIIGTLVLLDKYLDYKKAHWANKGVLAVVAIVTAIGNTVVDMGNLFAGSKEPEFVIEKLVIMAMSSLLAFLVIDLEWRKTWREWSAHRARKAAARPPLAWYELFRATGNMFADMKSAWNREDGDALADAEEGSGPGPTSIPLVPTASPLAVPASSSSATETTPVVSGPSLPLPLDANVRHRAPSGSGEQ